MKKIITDFSELKSVSKNVSNKNNKLVELYNKISKTNNELKSYWEGQDAQKYSVAVSKQLKDMKDLTDTIAYISEFLDFSSNYINEVMANNVKMLK